MARELSIRQLWEDLAFPQLTQTLHLAVGPTKIMLAFLMVCLVAGFGLLLDSVTHSVTVHPQAGGPFFRIEGQADLSYPDELAAYIANPDIMDRYLSEYRGQAAGRGVFSTLWHFFSARFNNATTQLLELGESNFFANLKNVFTNLWLCFRGLLWAIEYHTLYSLFFFSFSVAVVCFFGGSICRCAALEFARSEKPGLIEALQYSWEHRRHLLSAPLLPAGILLLFAAVVMLVGLAGNIPRVGELLIAVVFVFLLGLGLLMAMLIFATLAGAILLFPSVVYEGTSGLDAIGRSFSYVLSQPLWMIFYTLVEVVLGTLFYLLIRLFVFLILSLTYTLLSWGMLLAGSGAGKLERIWSRPSFFYFLNDPAGPQNWSETIASGVIYAFLFLLVGLVLSLILSFVFSATTVIYGLLRKKVDRVDFSQVDVYLERVAALPERRAAAEAPAEQTD